VRVGVTPRPLSTPGKGPVTIVQEVRWAPGPVWAGAENLAPTGIRSPDRPARSQSLYLLSYPATNRIVLPINSPIRIIVAAAAAADVLSHEQYRYLVFWILPYTTVDWFLQPKLRVFTARYAVSPYVIQICVVLRGLNGDVHTDRNVSVTSQFRSVPLLSEIV
jgi:hypothetical protein